MLIITADNYYFNTHLLNCCFRSFRHWNRTHWFPHNPSDCSDEGLLETSATRQIPRAKNIPYQPLLIKPIFTFELASVPSRNYSKCMETWYEASTSGCCSRELKRHSRVVWSDVLIKKLMLGPTKAVVEIFVSPSQKFDGGKAFILLCPK